MVDTTQLLIFLRGVNANFEITEELGALESLVYYNRKKYIQSFIKYIRKSRC